MPALLARMTLDEKADLIRGRQEPAATSRNQAGFIAGVPRLGIPPLRLADGPPGVVTRDASVGEVATMGVAATFDPPLAYRNGGLIADEARRLGIDVTLQPFINIDRDVTFSRGYNTFGEDPLLTGTMGAAEIRGIQDRGVMAMAKHYIAFDSDSQNIAVDSQTLHELYAAPFAQAVDAGVAAIMCSYNKINGDYACGNPATLGGILRDDLHFAGFVCSDWGAVHSNRQMAAGLDMEMPGRLDRSSPFAGITPSYFDLAPPPHVLPPPQYQVIDHYLGAGGMPEEPTQDLPDVSKAFPPNHA